MSPSEYTKMSLKHIVGYVRNDFWCCMSHLYTVYELNTSHTIHDNHPLKFARP